MRIEDNRCTLEIRNFDALNRGDVFTFAEGENTMDVFIKTSYAVGEWNAFNLTAEEMYVIRPNQRCFQLKAHLVIEY